MKIKYKLFISYLLIVAVFVLAGFLINTNVANIGGANKDVAANIIIDNHAKNYEKGGSYLQTGVYLYVHDNKEMGRQHISEGTELMRTSRNGLKNSLTDPAMLADLAEIERLEDRVLEASNNIVKAADKKESAALIEQNLATLQGRVVALNLKSSVLVDKARENMESSIERSKTYGDTAIKITSYASFASVVISLLVAFVMASLLTKPLRLLTETANKVSKGDIHAKVEVSSKDEIGDLAESFKRMINAFKIMDALSREK